MHSPNHSVDCLTHHGRSMSQVRRQGPHRGHQYSSDKINIHRCPHERRGLHGTQRSHVSPVILGSWPFSSYARVNTNDAQREGREDDIIAMVRGALVDDEANVRSAAARAFDILQEHLGTKAIDQTIPTLLEALRQPGASSGTALQALKEVMSVRAFSLRSYLPITINNRSEPLLCSLCLFLLSWLLPCLCSMHTHWRHWSQLLGRR